MRYQTSRKTRRGAYSVEVAIVLPMAFLFMFAIFDVGRAIATKQLLDNATRAAARQAVVGTTTLTTADIQTTVTNYLGGLTLQGMNVQVYQADPTTGGQHWCLDQSRQRPVHCRASDRQFCPDDSEIQPAAEFVVNEFQSPDVLRSQLIYWRSSKLGRKPWVK